MSLLLLLNDSPATGLSLHDSAMPSALPFVPGRVEVAPTATNLVVADASHAHTAGNIALVQTHSLAIQSASHGHTADTTSLTQVHSLTVQNASHTQTAGQANLTQTHNLTVQDASHGHTADEVVLGVAGQVGAHDGEHAHTADSISLSQEHALAVQASSHAHTAQNLDLSQVPVLQIDNATHEHFTDGLVLAQANALLIDDSSHALASDSLVFSQPIYTFSPPTFAAVDWSQGVDKRWISGYRADVPTSTMWRHIPPGGRGKTVIRIGGEYQVVVTPTQTLLETADNIRYPDGSTGPAVFLGGHVTEVTQEIRNELVAAGLMEGA